MRVCILMGLLLILGCTSKPNPYVSTYQEALDSTVQISINQSGYGSAFYIGDGLFITAAHCVVDHNGNLYDLAIDDNEVEVLAWDSDADVAIIQCDDMCHLKPFKLSNKQSKLTDIVYSVGTHLGQQEAISKGYVSMLVQDGYIVSAPINQGTSGGPLLNEKLEAIGVNCSILSVIGGFNGIAFCSDVKYAKVLLEDLAKD
jgi:serine protease Do